MKRNKILAALIVFAVLITSMAMLFACTPEAQEEDKSIHVRYDYNDGSAAIERVLTRQDVLTITPPERTGYDFSGWTLDKEGTQQVDADTLEDGATIYAQWTAHMFYVYFMIDETEAVKKVQVPYGSTVTPPTTEEINAKLPEGKEFKGWIDFSEDDVITKKTYYYAILDNIVIPDPEYTVTFTDGGEFSHVSTGKEGATINAPLKTEEPTKDGYTFVGWKTSDNVEFEDGMTFEKNETFYATWSLNRPANPTLSGKEEITYGESVTVSATLANPRNGINYAITWYIGSTKIGEGASVVVENLGATKDGEHHTVRCEVVAYDDNLTSDSASAIFMITVKKATLTATIEDINLTYGDDLPELIVTYSGFIGTDDASVVNEEGLKAETQYKNTSNVGKYTVSVSGVSADNYNIVSTDAQITVNKKSVTMSSTFNANDVYTGESVVKEVSGELFVGLLEGHTITLSAQTNGANVGSYSGDKLTTAYTIKDSNGNDASGNYSVETYIVINISAAPIQASVQNVTLAYNGTPQQANIKDVLTVDNAQAYQVTYSESEDGPYTSTMPRFENVGEHTVYIHVTAGDNYCDLTNDFIVTITPAPITITATTQEIVYGKEFALDQKQYEITGETFGKDIIFDLYCDYQAGEYAVGEHTIIVVNVNEIDNPNFDITTVDGTLNVTPALLTITLNNDSIVYGSEYRPDAEKLVKSYDGLYGTDNVNVEISTNYKQGNGVGEYEISCNINNSNYTLTTVNKGTLSVTKRALTIELNLEDPNLVYGEETMPEFNWFVVPDSGAFYGDDDKIFDRTVVFEHGYVAYDQETKAHGDAGNYKVDRYHFTDGENSTIAKNYDITLTEFSFSVAKRQVYLTLNDKSVVYGEDITFDFAKDVTAENEDGYYGFIAEDDIANNVTFSTNYTVGNTDTGKDGNSLNWTLVVNNENYDVRIDKSGYVYVTARDLTIKYEKTNIAQNSGEFSFDIIDKYATGLYDKDTITSGLFILKSTANTREYKFSGKIENDDTKEVRGLIVKRGDVDLTQYYNITFDVTLKVVEIPIDHNLSISETNVNVYNGEPQTVADLFINEDGVTVFVEYKNTRTGETGTSDTMPINLTNAGTYEITYTLTKDGKSPYTHTFKVTIHPYEFEIVLKEPGAPEDLDEPAFRVQFGDELNIDTNERYYRFKKLYGDKDVWSVLGFEYEYELAEALNVQIVTGYTVGVMGAGLHDVKSVTWNELPNCTITCNLKNQLEVTPQPIVVYGGNYTTVYGEEAVAYTTGFSTHLYVDGQTYNPNNNQFKNNYAPLAAQYITLTPDGYTAGKTGTFATIATCTNGNYEVKGCEVTMTVVARPITIKANDVEMTYGGNMPTLSYRIVSGSLYGEDTLDVTYGTINVTGAGEYSIVPSVTSDKYDVTVQNGTLTVKKAPLNITLSAQTPTITYGADMPTYTIASYSGFANGDDEGVLRGTLTVTCAYQDNKSVGTFKVNASGLEAANYDITYTVADLVVNKAQLTVSAAAFDGTIAYGSDMPTFPCSATGLVNGDTIAILNGKVKFDTTYSKGANVGTYTYNVKSVGELANYTVTVDNTPQTLTVVKADYTKTEVDNALKQLNLSGTYDPSQTLASFNDQLLGTGFAWVDSNIVPTCKVATGTGYAATYCTDTTNYNVYTGAYVKISLEKADTVLSGTTEYATDYTGNAIAYDTLINGLTSNHDENEPSTFSYSISAPSTMKSVVDGGIYTIHCIYAATDNYKQGEINVTLKVKYILYNNTAYVLEELSTLSSGTITLTSYNGVTHVNAFVSQNVTISEGVTLELLGDSSDTGDAATPTYSSGSTSYVDNDTSKILHRLTINQSTTVTVKGTIIIRGMMGTASSTTQGHTSGEHSQLINNGEMILNSGATMAVRGYIKGNGHATYNSGATVYMPFVINDFRGGTNTVTVYLKSKISPFNVYEMPNVQCNQTIMSGANVIGYLDLYASSSHNPDKITMIGSGGIIETDGRVEKSYNASTQKTTLTIVGNATLNSLTLEVMSRTVSMAEVHFPISWKYDIIVGNGTDTTKVSSQYDYKVLPGANITVNQNATLALTGSINVYSSFQDTSFGGAVYPSKSAANLVVNGTLDLSGASAFGGNIQSTQSGAKVVVGSKTTLSVTSKEGNSGSTSSAAALGAAATGFTLALKFVNVYTITETARFGAGTYTESTDSDGYITRSYSGGTALAQGKTYTYNGTGWSC